MQCLERGGINGKGGVFKLLMTKTLHVCQLIHILAMPPPGGQVGNDAHPGKKASRICPEML